MKWDYVRLGDVCSKIGSGATPKGGATVYINKGTSLIRSQNVYNLFFLYDGLAYITENAAKALAGVTVHNNDILINITGDSVARTCMVPDNVLPARVNQHVAIVRPDSNLMNPRFLNYYLASPYMQSFMLGLAVGKGASRNAMTKEMIAKFDVPCPPIDVQESIVDILSKYDSLIENNQKQIKLLEEAAQRLYKEWFVDLRFPGHETTPIVDGVPEGWKRKKLIEISDIQYGYAFDGSLFSTEKKGTPIVRIRNIPTGNTNDYTSEVADNQYLVYNGDIVVGMDGEFHINTWCGKTAYLVQRTCRIKPKQENVNGWLLQAIYSPIKYYEKTIVGATVAHLGKKHLDSIELLVGTENLYIPFQNIFEKRQILLNQNNELKEARDRLLPKLMNGEI